MIRKRKRVLLTVLAVILMILTYLCVDYINFMHKYGIGPLLPSSYAMPKDDSSIISNKYIQRLKVEEIYQNKSRNPFSKLIFDDKYYLMIHKINLEKDKKIGELLNIRKGTEDETTGVTYRVMGTPSFYLNCKGGEITPISKIYLTFAPSTDSLLTIANNDSVYAYHLYGSTISIRYSMNDPVDLILKGRGSNVNINEPKPVSLDVLFLKRNESIYFLVMASADPLGKISPRLLYDLVVAK